MTAAVSHISEDGSPESTAPPIIVPHGGVLINRLADESETADWQKRIADMPQLSISVGLLSDIEMIAVGGFSPLEGFVGEADFNSILENTRLANGVVWPIPITLPVSETELAALPEHQDIALLDAAGAAVAILHDPEPYTYDKDQLAEQVYRTTDREHPGVARMYAQGDRLLGGKITRIGRVKDNTFPGHHFDPAESRALFQERGWRRVVGFQTRNPIHRAHEYIIKNALEIVDGLFLHPLVGETKSDDIPADVRMKCYEVLIDNYFQKDRVVTGVLPARMHYAGPREAISHALIRKNYGCTHFIVGRDHAGVGSYYGTYDAQLIFDDFPAADIGITPLFFEHSFFCKITNGMATSKTSPSTSQEERIFLSGTMVREMLRKGQIPPVEFTRPEVAQVLIDAMQRAGQ